MKLKRVKGTLSHDFDTDHVRGLMLKQAIDKDDAIRILEQAVNVIDGLRAGATALHRAIDGVKGAADWNKQSIYFR